MKLRVIFVVLLFSALSVMIYAIPGSHGFTGIIDFPNAYNMRVSNYGFSVLIDSVQENTKFGAILEGGFISQVEAGIKVSTENEVVNKDLLKANVKFQFLQEANNPAMAIGFVEAEKVYGYLVGSKGFKKFLGINTNINITIGLMYSEDKDTDGFTALEFPLFSKVILQAEVFTYDDIEFKDDEVEKSKLVSYNLGGEFYTTNSVRTKVFWRERDDSFGVSINYIGIYK